MIHFAIFAKYWEAGKVKTRLARSIGAEAARDVYVCFLKHLLEEFGSAERLARRTLVFSPADARELFRAEVDSVWDLQPQSEGDLGVRMRDFFAVNAGDGVKNILIGSDTPNLDRDRICAAADALDECDLVLGPSADGGYYLIGMKQSWPEIFDGIAWSTDAVLPATIKRVEAVGATYRLLPEMNDVDELDDLKGLVAQLNESNLASDQKLLAALLQTGVRIDP